MKWLRSEKKEQEEMKQVKDPNTDIERRLAGLIQNNITNSEASKTTCTDGIEQDLETLWRDEYLVYKGGGLQWSTSIAYRSRRSRKVRPNSEDNFVFNALQIQAANITSSIPEVMIDANKERHAESAKKLTYISRFNDERNNFKRMWPELVLEFLAYGPAIVKVTWDQDWFGGAGPDRWIGDVRINRVDKKEFFPDPAIIDLENRMQECSYIIHRYRKKLNFIKSKWTETGKAVSEDNNTDQDEGGDPEMAYVYEYWHRGFPEYMPPERAKQLKERAATQEEQEDTYKAKDLYDMAKGNVEGIHVAYYCNGVLLEYRPYEFDDGLYPFAFTTRYRDENGQWGWGEIRNIKIPQILHNKADEIEMEAMSREGLGGGYYNEGSVSSKQLEQVKQNSGKGGMWFAVNNILGMKEREGVRVPASITNYKEHKQRMVETISQVTPIQQGMAPSGKMPFRAISELGARSDVRMKQAANKLENLLCLINKLRISRFAQFYTEERYFRLKLTSGNIVEDTFRNEDIFDAWAREQVQTGVDEMGQPIMEQKFEIFVPEFDISVSVINSKPTDRNYYTNVAFTMFDRQLMTGEDLWKTIDEGKFPPVDVVLDNLSRQQQAQQQAQQQMAMQQQGVVAPENDTAFNSNAVQTGVGVIRPQEFVQNADFMGQLANEQKYQG